MAEPATLAKARVCIEAGEFSQARALLESVLRRSPSDLSTAALLAGVLLRQREFERAAHWAERAAAIKPGRAVAYSMYGEALLGAGRWDQAEAPLEQALALNPSYVPALMLLSYICTRRREFTRARALLERARAVGPGLEDAVVHLALNTLEFGRPGEALSLLRRFRSGSPRSSLLQGTIAHVCNYDPGVTPEEGAAEHARYGEIVSRGAPRRADFRERAPGEGPLKVGFFSPNLNEHSVAFFFEPLLEGLDRDRFTPICYALSADSDATTTRLRGLASAWREAAGLDDAALLDLAARDRLDIAVDLAGNTTDHRLMVFAAGLAPVQATYLGYPASTGLPSMGWRVVDGETDPPGAERLCVERLVRLPGCFLCYRPPALAPAPERDAARPITFGSFNVLRKVNGAVLDAWSRIVLAAPGSRLLLKAYSLGDAGVKEHVASGLVARGLAPDQFELIAFSPTRAEHLALYGSIDVALDPFPYSGTTTTCEALHMGTPVVTLRGTAHAGRVGASLLTAAGLPELVANSVDEYIRLATELGASPARRAGYHATLRGTLAGSPLCDASGFARRFGEALSAMWAARDPRPGAGALETP